LFIITGNILLVIASIILLIIIGKDEEDKALLSRSNRDSSPSTPQPMPPNELVLKQNHQKIYQMVSSQVSLK
jgi:hypothetical protein